MQHARGPRPVVLPAQAQRATLAALTLALAASIGCQPDRPTGDGGVDLGQPLPSPGGPSAVPLEAGPNGEPASADGGLPQCAQYKEIPDTYGYCIYKYAGGFPTASEVNRLCGLAGEWEQECRHAWVAGRMNPSSGVSMEDLMSVCADNPDCTFEVLDFRPSNEVTVQMDRCVKWAGRFAADCVSHAMQRWYLTQPAADDVARVARVQTRYPDKVGYWVAASVQCRQVGQCPQDTHYLDNHCLHNVDTFARNPRSCPADKKQPLPHNRGRQSHGGAPTHPGAKPAGGHAPGNKPPRPPR